MGKHTSRKISRKRKVSQVLSPIKSIQPTEGQKKTPVLANKNTKPQPKNLLQLPLAVLERLLMFLEVSSLEKLSSTCGFLHQLISGKNITTLDFPFSSIFLAELTKELVIEKKPLLRLRSIQTKSLDNDLYFFSKHHISVQLALLDLSKLRELHLQPVILTTSNLYNADRYTQSYWDVVKKISSLGYLANITRLDILVDRFSNLAKMMRKLPGLLHLGITITVIGSDKSFNPWLERSVAACRARSLSITILDQFGHRSRKKTIRIFNNCFVERLTLRLPCNFNLHLAMTALQEVVLEHQEPNCMFSRSTLRDRTLHCSGLCAVSLASCFQNCPRLKIFAGVQIGNAGQDRTFPKWSNSLKKPFHSDYVAKGGLLDLKTWSKVRGGRWFCRQEPLPAETGYDWGDF